MWPTSSSVKPVQNTCLRFALRSYPTTPFSSPHFLTAIFLHYYCCRILAANFCIRTIFKLKLPHLPHSSTRSFQALSAFLISLLHQSLSILIISFNIYHPIHHFGTLQAPLFFGISICNRAKTLKMPKINTNCTSYTTKITFVLSLLRRKRRRSCSCGVLYSHKSLDFHSTNSTQHQRNRTDCHSLCLFNLSNSWSNFLIFSESEASLQKIKK